MKVKNLDQSKVSISRPPLSVVVLVEAAKSTSWVINFEHRVLFVIRQRLMAVRTRLKRRECNFLTLAHGVGALGGLGGAGLP